MNDGVYNHTAEYKQPRVLETDGHDEFIRIMYLLTKEPWKTLTQHSDRKLQTGVRSPASCTLNLTKIFDTFYNSASESSVKIGSPVSEITRSKQSDKNHTIYLK